MKVAIVVPGRFHAFDLAKGLLGRGHDVRVFTNYPRFAARRFGLPPPSVVGFPFHAVLAGGARRWTTRDGNTVMEAWLHRTFGRWAARVVHRERWDAIHAFSGVAEELMQGRPHRGEWISLVRGSSHIRTQFELLQEESLRCGEVLERPSQWMIGREEREYASADHVVTLSSFTHQTFLDRGFPRERLLLLPLGVDVAAFRAGPEVIAERKRRVLAGEPLRVLFVGTVSFRKGLMDMIDVARSLDPARFTVRAVGAVRGLDDAGVRQLSCVADVRPRVRQAELAETYAWGDVFLFPTIEDGFPVVQAQALACGLPMLTTPNSAGPDLVENHCNGWVLPARQPHAFVERLRWLDANREELERMVETSTRRAVGRSWDDVAKDFEALWRTRQGSGEQR